MKILSIILLLGLLTPISTPENIEISDELVLVNFHSKLSFNDLVKIKLDLAEEGISLHYKKIVFSDQNDLREIAIEVNCHDGFKGTATSSQITNNSTFGFVRNYKGKSPFAIGDIGEYLKE